MRWSQAGLSSIAIETVDGDVHFRHSSQTAQVVAALQRVSELDRTDC